MALRWRKSGRLLCAAKHQKRPGDIYVCDHLHYQLSVELKVVVPDKNEVKNGLWHWLKDVFVTTN